MELENAKNIILELLKKKGKATNSAILRLLDGDNNLLQEVREELIMEDLARDKEGIGLVFVSEPIEELSETKTPAEQENKKLRIFLSYGHDANEELVRMIKADLEKSGHDVWFDKNKIKFGDDWRYEITDGIVNSNKFISFLSKHSTRDPGVCLDEIAIAIGAKGGNISTILVEGETEVQAPPSISHVQWLDMHDWQEQKAKDETSWNEWYQEKLDEIIRVVESEESRQFAGDIEKLSKYLKPISSDSRVSQLLSKGFVGREWMWDAVEKWRTNPDRSSRLFWIMGGPGVGKSAFAAHFTHFGKDKIIAAQFCEWNKPDHRNAARVFRSIAFQLATRLPEYRSLLLTLPEINQLDGKNAAEIFDYLFANPLQKTIKGGRERYLILIDALDEAAEGERNDLVETLARHAPELPEWLGMLITSRPESSVTSPLQGLKPYVLDTGSEENKDDIRLYLFQELKSLLDKRNNANELVEQILEKSEGVFLYVERVCDNLNKDHLSLDHLDQFPVGLGGIFRQFFDRQFPDLEYFRTKIRPVLRAILAAPEPLPVDILQKLFTWQEDEMYDIIRILGSLFPVMQEAGRKVIKPYHKSLTDWLTNQIDSDHYYVNTFEGYRLLVDYGWQLYTTGADNMDIFFIKWLPYQLQTLKKWDDLTNLLCDLDFIQAKAAAKLTYDLVNDFNEALEVIPDNAEEIAKEKARQARMDKYTQDLIACAEGKISRFELEVPESITPWTEEQINAEIERIRTNPNRADKLKDFRNFLGQEASNLEKYANKFTHFAIQQAWNFANDGPVGKSAEWFKPEEYTALLLYSNLTRPHWKTMPQVLKILKGHTSYVRSVAITPDGKRAVSGSSDKTCILWDLESGKLLKIFKEHTAWVKAVAISPDGKRVISGSDDKTCILWDLESGKPLKTLESHTSYVNAVTISPDGKLAVSGSDDETCIVWDLESGNPLKTFKGHTGRIQAIAISPDGNLALSGSTDYNCILWDLETGNPLKTLKRHTSYVSAVAISPDGKLAVSGSFDKTCILWDLESGKPLKTFTGHTARVEAIVINPDGKRVISGSCDNTCILWDLESGKPLKIFKEHTNDVEAVAITPDGKRAVSGSSDETCIVWDIETGNPLKAEKGHTDWILAVTISPDGKQAVSGSGDKTCILWDLESGNPLKTLKEHTGWIQAIAITPDGKCAVSGSSDKTCILWDLESGKLLKIFKGHINDVKAVAITPDGKRAVSGSSDKTCILWDLESGKPLKILLGHTDLVRTITLTPAGKQAVSGSEDNTCILWDTESGKPLKILLGHTKGVLAVAISPDGKRAVSGSWDETCILWDLESGKLLKTLKGHTGGISVVAISPDGKRAVSGSYDNTCILWDLESGNLLKTLKGHTGDVHAISISLDGKRAVSGSYDNTCILWDLESGETVSMFITSSGIHNIYTHAKRILGGSQSGEVFILDAGRTLLCPGTGILTARHIWDYKVRRYQALSADCPFCGHRFSPPKSVMDTIEEITKNADLLPEQSPCLELPDEAWEDPGLLSECSKCREGLKFNPFVVEGE